MQTNLATYLAKVKAERGATAASQTKYFLKDLPGELSPRELDAWRTSIKADGRLSASSINRKLNAVRTYLKWLVATERLELSKSAISDNLGFFTAEKRKVCLPEQDAIAKLITRAVERSGVYGQAYCRFIALGLFAGLRPGEIEGLVATDLPVRKQYIHVKRTKTGVERHAYYSQSRVLSSTLPRLRLTEGYIVRSGGQDWFAPAAEASGWGTARRNTLRKLHASYMAASGKYSEWELMQHLGHTTTTSIKNYRDPEVLSTIRPGADVEAWMGLDPELCKSLIERILEGTQ